MKWRARLLLLFAAAALACAVVRADEIRLKDGSKIIGTIVGYEDGAFKVETAYGFAMVRKASILEIVPTDAAKPAETKDDSKAADSAAPKATTKNAATPPSAPAPAPAAKASEKAAVPPAPASASAVSPAKPGTKPPSDTSSATPALTPVSASVSAPGPAPKPVPIQETVVGNLYINKTYGFSMYRPPDWGMIADSRSAMPEAITALGTDDHSTLLVIGRDMQGGSIDARAAATTLKLHDIYDNYRPLLSTHINIAGLPAAEQRFRGSADGHDWSVIEVTLARGNEVFTILGMTYADSDLIQFQENVITKAIGSLQFTAPQ